MLTLPQSALPDAPAEAVDPLAALPWPRRHPFAVLALGLLLLAGVVVLALASGSGAVPLARVPVLLWSPDDTAAAEILHRLRLPRVLAALSTGALLALAGALMQILLRNPLADPYVLGLSGGAALGALSVMALGAGALAVHGGALAGALVAVVVVFSLARHDLGRLEAASSQDNAPRLLLTGVMCSSLAMAGVSLLLTLSPTERLRGMLFWMLGDLSGADMHPLVLAAAPALCLALWPLGRALNLMLRGPGPAQMLGVPVGRVRLALYLAASTAAGLAVATAGTVGFVGLVVPHALRLLLGNDQRLLLPASALGGAAFLLAADTVARTLMAPLQLPVGAITALVGAPVFILLLTRGPGRRGA
ncbi:FecCD family ABC transporter permease [Ideonella livida]|uniref:Iron ABC transporter permease n=1 Tax=Ideonella livida TaxID=2707176 RepID=A0A7C9TIT7_9BURK|nr:iron ABC transporter permease [Ideonella livida]NDY91298.1 iron ABC transporter permease [Ideonella livida]